MEIKNPYLMWIGKEHYSKISDWEDEAVSQGISKRLPSPYVAAAMMAEGAVVFVAHDEGEYRECEDCHGTYENPDWRKAEQDVSRLSQEVEVLQAKIEGIHDSIALKVCDEKGGKVDIARLDKLIANRVKKMQTLRDAAAEMGRWLKGGTGGTVTIMRDGKIETWDHRRFNYWLHQPKRFNADDAISRDMCESCGGTGRLPEGKVFGLFIPGDFEYIIPEGVESEIAAMIEKMGIKLVPEAFIGTEARRGCGSRKPGGVYVVARTEGVDSTKTKEVVAALVAEGKLEPAGVEISGQFARFLAPVPIDAKRFRGIKRWNLDPAVEDEAEMITDAM